MLKGFGYATIAIGCLSSFVAFIWGIVSALTSDSFFAFGSIFVGLLAAAAVLVIFLGNGLMMIKLHELSSKENKIINK